MKIQRILKEELKPNPKQIAHEVITRLEGRDDFSEDAIYDIIWDVLHEPPYDELDDTYLMDLEHDTANIVKGKLQ